MTLYTELSDSHLIVTTDCAVFFTARSKGFRRCGATGVHLIGALSAGSVDHGFCGDKITCNWHVEISL